MRSTTGRIMLRVAGVLFSVLASFWVTLKVMDYWGISQAPNRNWMQEPAYNAASLPRLNPGQTLAFTDDQNKSALISGWANLDPGGVWSNGHTAFIGFVVDSGAGGAAPKQAVVRMGAYFVSGKLIQQRVQVSWRGKNLRNYDLKGLKGWIEEFTIPLGDVNTSNDMPVILRFDLPDAKSPQEVENKPMTYVVGIYLISLRLLP